MSIPRPDGPDVDIGPTMLATSWTLFAAAGTVVTLRVYTQLKITHQFGIGDLVMVASMVFGITQMLLLTLAHHFGWGRHFFYLTDEERILSMKMEFISEPIGIMTSTLGRVSFTCLMFRLFGTTQLRKAFLWSLITVNLVVNLVTCITIFTQCGNAESLWDPIGHPSKCWSPNVQADIGFFQGSINSSLDLILTFLPSTIFWTLQMKMRIKIGLAALLGLSIFAFAASIVKTVKIQTLGERSDYTFNTVSFMSWVVIENTVVIIAASIPLLRPLFNIAKEAAISAYGQSSYELGSRGVDGTNSRALKSHPKITSKSTNLASSSEENILPIQKQHSQKSKKGSTNSVLSSPGINVDLENGVIKKETTYQVRYDRDVGIYDAEREDWGQQKE